MAQRRISRSASAVDRISILPNDNLIHILSFLTTKESVATSILSKRWIHLWHHVPNLIFPEININDIQSIYTFNKFVFSVLNAQEAANFINTFHLHIHYSNPNLAYHLSFPNVTKWINLVVQRKLNHLLLHLDTDKKFLPKLPISIFICRTLVSLALRQFDVKGFSFSSNGIQLPSLKSLHLVYIKFSEVNDFVFLLAGCPILEDLEASDIHFQDTRDCLTIQEYKNLSFPKLTRAHISAFWCNFPAKAFTNSKSLSIDTILCTNEDVNRLQRPYDEIYIFHNLTHLEVHDYWSTVIHVLHLCPKLQNLKLCQGFNVLMFDGEDDQESWEEPEFVPQCLSSCFTTCIIQDFLGRKHELLLAEYILGNAQNLQTMIIECECKLLKIERKLSQCLKASATCQLSVFENI